MSGVLFLGSKRVGLRCLQAALDCCPGAIAAGITVDDSSDIRTAHSEFVELAHKRDLTLHTVARRAEAESLVRRYAPDLCLVVGWYWLIPRPLLTSVPKGFIGVHFSLLPKYRGGSPLVWALINGDNQTGVTIFSFTEQVDAGDIWAQREIPIGRYEYVSTVLERLENESASLIADVLPRVLSGDLHPTPQDDSKATFCAPRSPEDGRINWGWPADRVARFVRAQSRPYPGAFTYAGTEKTTIWRASTTEAENGPPGSLLRKNRGLLVTCGDGRAILVEEAQRGEMIGPLELLLDVSLERLGNVESKES
jgi:methionyl-tRNA formyltransferase